jgi:hypothetical protein
MESASLTATLVPGWRGLLANVERAAEVKSAHFAAHPTIEHCIAQSPFALLDALQAAQPPMRGYTYVSPALRAFVGAVPLQTRAPYLAALLLWHIDRFESVFPTARVHPEFRLQAIDSIHRILDQIAAGLQWADIDDDAFMKDLGVVRLSVLAAVAQLIYPYSGMMRAPLIKAGVRALAYVYGRCGGAAPFLEIHTHKSMMAQYFNPQGWDETYRLVSLALDAFPRARGMLGISWFYDPQLADISPRLGYLREVPLARGARLVQVETSLATVALATSASPTRRALHAEGKYIPVSNALIWSRRDILSHYG